MPLYLWQKRIFKSSCHLFSMLDEIIMSIIQAATEFLPVSSDGHLALYSNLFSEPSLFFITFLHISSLLAVLIFTRKEIKFLLSFKNNANKLWSYIIIATIPGALIGFLAKDLIEQAFSSLLVTGIGFLFTGTIILFTRIKKNKKETEITSKKVLFIGLMQSLALLPGVSRSGMTISTALFSGIEKEKAVKFSFLLFIPLVIGAFSLEMFDYYKSNISVNIPATTLLISFAICFLLSLLFLNLLSYIIKKGKFWMFSFYCFLIGIITLILHFTISS
ncbi:UDP-diphosphatase [Candidatus Pacearchaeota archaeon CG10_big_fil_rev_8_21_14_0_10_31_9]|nr:MAG: UDP-diphosphatase [Candidatus Pacearchaeota archaeon CG10_big_fil_rev_8_21_14_0_10_31_9]PIZ82707.1 MAG: UDP-diphosphatase [Candidatus Pacearchaeota archaeon CG_4_10_14_0_2_um_filter_05_32_18]